MEERQYVRLKKIKTIGADLGNDQFMFNPFSMTIDREGNLYVYDNLQARIIKFDKNLKFVKAIGRVGRGPGEFFGAHRTLSVFIKIGRDDKLYAHDLNAFKIMVFDREGRYIAEYRRPMGGLQFDPAVDAAGNIYFLTVKDRLVRVYNQHNTDLFKFTIGPDALSFLFYRSMAFRDLTMERLVAVTGDSRILIYFQPSSTMYVIKNRKVKKKIRIWPADGLEDHKHKVREILEKNKFGYTYLFPLLVPDEDDPDIVYLQYGINKKKRINALYRFNLRGGLEKVLYLDYDKTVNLDHFKVKRNDLFYAIKGEYIIIYKEAK